MRTWPLSSPTTNGGIVGTRRQYIADLLGCAGAIERELSRVREIIATATEPDSALEQYTEECMRDFFVSLLRGETFDPRPRPNQLVEYLGYALTNPSLTQTVSAPSWFAARALLQAALKTDAIVLWRKEEKCPSSPP
jgi:hypothetical protein